uniref:Uncharacterized protein n=1 Tax=Gopherus agassizii TaxID=38772 RepID=A0A452HPC7_9SAUR
MLTTSNFLEGQVAFSHPRLRNRSVMHLDVRGCTRATLTGSVYGYPMLTGVGNPLNPICDGSPSGTSGQRPIWNTVCSSGLPCLRRMNSNWNRYREGLLG